LRVPNLQLHGLRPIDRFSDTTDQQARRLADVRTLCYELAGNLMCHDAVRLTYVADDVLAGGRFERHRPAGGDLGRRLDCPGRSGHRRPLRRMFR
jgi:hypothetical protein